MYNRNYVKFKMCIMCYCSDYPGCISHDDYCNIYKIGGFVLEFSLGRWLVHTSMKMSKCDSPVEGLTES